MLKNGIVKLSLSIGIGIASFGLYSLDTTVVIAASQMVDAASAENMTISSAAADSAYEGITIAQKKKKKKGRSKGRKRILSSEKSVKMKRGSKTNLDFDAVDISGQRKTPLGSMVGTLKDRKGFNFIEIRKEWHNEMVQSASNLD